MLQNNHYIYLLLEEKLTLQ